MAPVSHDTLEKLMKAVKQLLKLKGKSSEKVAEEITSHKKILIEMDNIFVEQSNELLFVAELVRGTNWIGQTVVAANIATKKAMLNMGS
ncbi:unnamed protein product [Prunus armeniaca]|uniref:Uncharacterized protein n=1 Tax=Prunus armeniaca TaxID=36596 RepID=A0A6J5UX31_PRUAR|nr:unnamed protein product [Prunus armeniaca]CAB4310168.1 unnamed protein product [Prunus armeniaca]